MRQTPITGRGRALAASAAVALVAAAPAAVHAAASSPAKPATNAASAHAAASQRHRKRLRVTLRDFTITVRHRTRRVRAGRYTIRVTNLGPSAHNLTIKRSGFPTKATPTIAAGETARIKIRLRKGRYTLFCSIPGHAQLGMLRTLRVRRHL